MLFYHYFLNKVWFSDKCCKNSNGFEVSILAFRLYVVRQTLQTLEKSQHFEKTAALLREHNASDIMKPTFITFIFSKGEKS